jgi:hypothetical protein
MSDAPAAPVTVAVTNAPLPDGFSVPQVVALARDLAMDMYERPALLKKHNVTDAQFATLEQIPYFQNVVKQMAEEWNAPKSAQQRLAIGAAVGLEEVLPDVIARAKVKNEPLQGVAQLVKVLADIAGANQSAGRQAAPAREQFKITINLGADQEVYNKTKPIITIEQPASDPVEVQSQPEGLGSLLSLSPEPEKA